MLDRLKKVSNDGKKFFNNKIITNKRTVKYKRDKYKKYLKDGKFDIKSLKNIDFSKLKNINIKNINIDKIKKINLKNINFNKIKDIKNKNIFKGNVEKSRVVRIFDYILLGEIGIFFILSIIGAISSKAALGIWKHLIIPVYNLIYCSSQYLVFKMGSFVLAPLITMFIILIITLLLNIIFSNVKYDKDVKYRFINKTRLISNICVIFIIFELGTSILTLNNPRLNHIYMKKQTKNKYKVDDVIKLEEDMKNKVIEYSRMMTRDKDGAIVYNGDIVSTASDDLKKISSKYDILEGPYIKKMYHFDNSEFSSDPSTTGYTFIDNVGISFRQGLPQTINTAAHELCHTKGVSRENEAVLCSVIAGVESDNLVSNYGAYIEAYFRASDALYLIDYDKALSHENEIHDLCINDHYKEICQFYMKDLDVYVNNSDSMIIATYKLKSYDKEYINELIDSLKDFKPKLYINNKDKIKRKELDKYFGNDNDYLVIKIKNSEDDFIKSKKIIDKYSSRLKSIRQIYDGIYKGMGLDKKEAIKYYTSSVPNSNIFTRNKLEVFDYSRVVRLLLEYFDSKNV